MVEALQTRPEIIGSDAFRIEYKSHIPEQVIVDDIVSYLGEYRFNLQKHYYSYKFKDGKLRDPHRDEPMENLSQRAVEKNKKEGKSYQREQAEVKGFRSLDLQLRSAKIGDTVVWASPPGSKEDGYGDYGFLFMGNISESNGYEKTIKMSAIRLEDPKIEEYQKAWYMLTGEDKKYEKPEDFLANPRVLGESLEEGYIDALLGVTFSFRRNYEEKEEFLRIISRMNPLIKDFVSLARFGSKDEKIKAFNAIENYFIKLKNEDKKSQKENIVYSFSSEKKLKIADIVGQYGFKPQEVRGSCGSTGNSNGFTSSNIFSRGSVLNSTFEETEWFTCPKCSYKADGPIGNTCPGCGLTKEAYAEESGVTCD